MKLVKKTAEYAIFQRNDKRYAVRGTDRKWVNGDNKVSILQKEKFLKTPAPKAAAKPAKEEVAEETVEEPTAAETTASEEDTEADKSDAE